MELTLCQWGQMTAPCCAQTHLDDTQAILISNGLTANVGAAQSLSLSWLDRRFR